MIIGKATLTDIVTTIYYLDLICLALLIFCAVFSFLAWRNSVKTSFKTLNNTETLLKDNAFLGKLLKRISGDLPN